MTVVSTKALARWRGRTFTASLSFRDKNLVILKPLPGEDAPEGFAKIPGTAGVGREVSPTELDEWWSTRTYFRWRGKRFLLVGRDGDRLDGSLYDVDDEWARENGLHILERSVARGTFDVHEVEELHEERTDILARWRERTGNG